jgi:hypothetical protein
MKTKKKELEKEEIPPRGRRVMKRKSTFVGTTEYFFSYEDSCLLNWFNLAFVHPLPIYGQWAAYFTLLTTDMDLFLNKVNLKATNQLKMLLYSILK